MQNSGRLWFPVLGGSILGAALHLQQRSLWPVSVCLLLLSLAWLVAVRGWRRHPLWLMLTAALLVLGGDGLRAQAALREALPAALEGVDVRVTGTVADMPQQGEQGVRFRFDVEQADHVGLPPRLYLAWYRGTFASREEEELSGLAPALRAGERWQFTVRLKAPHGAMNPFGFDFELWLWEQGLHATGYVRDGPHDRSPERIGQDWSHPVERLRQATRDAIYARIADPRRAGVIAALVVGDQSAIERADWDVFRATGVAHLMSISGLHITMFGWLATLVTGWLWRRSGRLCLRLPAPHAALICGVVAAALYAVFSGWGIPSQRTVWMMAALALLRLRARTWPPGMVWLLAMAVVVALDPWAMLQAGFWLSFVAVGVLFWSGSSGPAAAQPAPGGRVASLKQTLAALWREQWVVTLALTPLSVLLFQQVSVIGMLANALAIPWVTLVVTPLAMLGVFASPCWDAAGWAVQGLTGYLQWLASWPMASIVLPAPPLLFAVAGVLGGALLVMRGPWRLRCLGLPLLLPALLWVAPRPREGEFELLAADIGQGNAVLVRTARHALLYDTGPKLSADSDAGQRTLVPLLRALGERLDLLILSHRDSDHTGGARAVLLAHPQAGLLSSLEPGHELLDVRPGRPCVAGQNWRWDGVEFEILHPQPGEYQAPSPRPNARSCVLRLRAAGGVTALLAGDLEQPQEAALVARGALAPVDWMLVPHHGSKTSSSAAWLDALAPRISVVQAGYRNRFGHPAGVVLARYAERGLNVVDTVHCGAAWWGSEQPARMRCQREKALRYWHHRAPPLVSGPL